MSRRRRVRSLATLRLREREKSFREPYPDLVRLFVRELLGRAPELAERKYTFPLDEALVPRVHRILTSLSCREEMVVRALRLSASEVTMRAVGDYLGLSRSRIGQIFARACRKLRHPSHLHALLGLREIEPSLEFQPRAL